MDIDDMMTATMETVETRLNAAITGVERDLRITLADQFVMLLTALADESIEGCDESSYAAEAIEDVPVIDDGNDDATYAAPDVEEAISTAYREGWEAAVAAYRDLVESAKYTGWRPPVQD